MLLLILAAPIIDDIDISLDTHVMHAPLLDETHDLYRQSPSPMVDATWENLTDHGIVVVSSADILKAGLNPEEVVRLGPEFNMGPDAYGMETDILHKVHCLNMIRKDVYFDHYWLEMYPDRIPSERHRRHTNHCIHVILQSLLCDANTDLIPQVWMEDYSWPTPRFTFNRKCGNIEGIREWEKDHKISAESFADMKKPSGVRQIPMSAELRKAFEVEEGWDAQHGIISP